MIDFDYAFERASDLRNMATAQPIPGSNPSPAQSIAITRAARAMQAAELVIVTGSPGMGRTLVLKELQSQHGGQLLTAADLMRLTTTRNARRYEQSLYELVSVTLADRPVLYFDDVSGFQNADRRAGYNRIGQISAVLRVMRDIATAQDKRIVVSTDLLDPSQRASHMAVGASWDDKGIVVKIPALGESDYHHILVHYLGEEGMMALDVARLFAGSRRLTAKMLTLLARLIIASGIALPTADQALAIIDRDMAHGNFDLAEVEPVAMADLIGVEAIATRIDRAVLLPLREPELARELGLVSKRGILLHGPPGTGKTTIGRALAHMMRGKFFLIDGDFVHDGPMFQSMIDAVFEAAVRSSPSVIFLDDADVILNDPDMQHFGRYMLTKLDGLQSESLANVCVIMTAMNIASMPPALLRSGRLEVWLEMRLPDARARIDMIRSHAERLPFLDAATAAAATADTLAQLTEGFTPADLRRLVGDAAGRLAFDRYRGRPEQPFGDYLEISSAALGDQKRLAETAMGERGGLRFY